jgi:hypothetical protein
MKEKHMKRLLLALLLAFCFMVPGLVQAEQIKLIWQHDLPADLAGFKIYAESEAEVPGCPSSPAPANMIVNLPYVEGEPLTTNYQLTGQENETFHFIITAYDEAANESACSMEVTYKLKDLPPNEPFSVIIEVVLPTTTTSIP